MNHSPTSTGRFEALDALRGLCAIVVVFFHIPIDHALKFERFFPNLQVCVDLFFVLSGFVLYHAYGRRLADGRDGLRFVAKRVFRLWPLHATMLGLFVLLEVAKFGYGRGDAAFTMESQPFAPGHAPGEIVTNLLFLQSFGLHSGMSWNGPAWSAAVEFYVSILFAGLILAFPRRHLAVFAALCLGAGLALAAVSPATLFVSTDWGVLRAILGVFAGGLVCALRRRSPEGLPAASLLEAASLAGLIGAVALVPAGLWQFLFLPTVCAVIYVFSFEGGRVSGLFRTRWLQALGLWSYSIYMVHSLVFQVMKTGATFVGRKAGLDLVTWRHGEKLVVAGSPEEAVAVALILSVVLVVPVAALTYRFVELPGMALAQRTWWPRTWRQRTWRQRTWRRRTWRWPSLRARTGPVADFPSA